jgi:hypothetical protein
MSRSPSMDPRDGVRSPEQTVSRGAAEGRGATVPLDRLTLRPGRERQPVRHRGRTYSLRESDVRTLATVGTFRVVRAAEVQAMHSSRDAWTGDLRHLREQGLVEVKTVTINRQPAAVAVLTRDGKSLLEAHQDRSNGRSAQAYHAGLVKPRELAHDAQLYALYQAEASRIEADGGRVERVLLDYELKRDYQRFLNRPHRPDDDLPVVDGHLELPDLRIEFQSADGELRHRDVELVTEHYSRAQLAGKSRAGFSMYRAAGGRTRGGSVRTGSTPTDPHHLEWLG